MVQRGDWEARVQGMLKAELKRRNVGYEELARRLQVIGVNETPASIANKISRGRFTAVFMLQVMAAVGAREIRLD